MTFFRSNPMVAAFAFILVGVLCFFAGAAWGQEPTSPATQSQTPKRASAPSTTSARVAVSRVPVALTGAETGNAVLAFEMQREAWGRAVQTAMNAGAGAVGRREQHAASSPDVGVASPSSPQPSGSCGGATNGADRYIARESGGDPNAVNPSSGARGCWQLMPMHFGAGGTCSDLVPGPDDAACASRLPLSAWAL